MNDSLYDILKIKKDATPEEIKEAYRNAAKSNHPDKEGSHDKMTEVNKAYAVLRNPESRKRYDETGSTEEIPFDKKFKAFVQDTFMKLIEARDINNNDLIGEFAMYIDTVILANKKGKKDHEDKLKRLQIVLDRLESKSENNQLGEVIQMNIDHLNQIINTIAMDIEFITQCKERLENYSYNFDEAQENNGEGLWLSEFKFKM